MALLSKHSKDDSEANLFGYGQNKLKVGRTSETIGDQTNSGFNITDRSRARVHRTTHSGDDKMKKVMAVLFYIMVPVILVLLVLEIMEIFVTKPNIPSQKEIKNLG